MSFPIVEAPPARVRDAVPDTERQLEQLEAIGHIGHWQWHRTTGCVTPSAEVCRIFSKDRSWRPRLAELLESVAEEDRDWLAIAMKVLIADRAPEASFDYSIEAGGQRLQLHSSARLEYAPDGRVVGAFGTTQDVTEIRGYQQRLDFMAFYDGLTELPNRQSFTDRLRKAIDRAQAEGLRVGVMIMDLDNFKEVNDTLGHQAGDAVLRETAARLRRCLREYDTVARLGGDEFGFVLAQMKPDADIGPICTKILAAVGEAYEVEGMEIFLTGSIGVARYPDDGANISDLLQHADATMYHAKDTGRNNFKFYAASLTQRITERLSLAARLHRAEANGELELYYQPQIDLASGRLLGAEALLRWNHPDEGLVPPDKFIGIAEDTGLIVSIGDWVLRTACEAARAWNIGRTPPVRIAVNVSPRQIRSKGVVDRFRDILRETRCDPAWIEIEITESTLLDNTGDVLTTLAALHDLGLAISIDDFGTGYSALCYLTRFPAAALKIDRSFVAAMTHRHEAAELVKAIIAMARSLNFTLVAEGIEDAGQEHFLRLHGCHCGQGYLYGKPMPHGAFAALLDGDETAPGDD